MKMPSDFGFEAPATPHDSTGVRGARRPLVVSAAIAATLAVPIGLYSRAFGREQIGDASKFTPLDLKPGYWTVHVHVSAKGVVAPMPPDTLKQITANLTPEQKKKFLDDLNAKMAEAEAQWAKGNDRDMNTCPLKQDFETQPGADMQTNNCTTTMQSTPQGLHMHWSCASYAGGPASEQTTDFERVDAENFKGTVVETIKNDPVKVVTETFTGKWVRDACAGPAPSLALKPGEKVYGPAAVALHDPLRVVAMIEDKQITAQQGWNLINKVPPPERMQYNGRLPELLQKLYMQRGVADEAVKLRLDKEAPWAEKLLHARQQILQRAQNYEGDPNIPPALMAQWENARQHILWDAYFAQASTKEEHDALMAKEKEKYKITVQDADFFNGSATQ